MHSFGFLGLFAWGSRIYKLKQDDVWLVPRKRAKNLKNEKVKVECKKEEEDHKNNFHTKIRKIHTSIWKLQVKNSKTVNFGKNRLYAYVKTHVWTHGSNKLKSSFFSQKGDFGTKPPLEGKKNWLKFL